MCKLNKVSMIRVFSGESGLIAHIEKELEKFRTIFPFVVY